MNVVDLEQGTPEWHEWRRSHIGASDVPIILGLSKWCTPLQLWKRKVGFEPEQADNYAMKRGRDLEASVRDKINARQYDSGEFEQLIGTHDTEEWASASFDGYNYADGEILEIKCPGKVDHDCAIRGRVPDHYWPQVQWQLFVSGFNRVLYASYSTDDLRIVDVYRDDDYINGALHKCKAFYDCVTELREPERCDRDAIQMTAPEFELHAQQWKEAHAQLSHYKEQVEYHKNQMRLLASDQNCEGFGVRMTRVNREGNINWKALYSDAAKTLPLLADMFIPDNYRSDPVEYFKISEAT